MSQVNPAILPERTALLNALGFQLTPGEPARPVPRAVLPQIDQRDLLRFDLEGRLAQQAGGTIPARGPMPRSEPMGRRPMRMAELSVPGSEMGAGAMLTEGDNALRSAMGSMGAQPMRLSVEGVILPEKQDPATIRKNINELARRRPNNKRLQSIANSNSVVQMIADAVSNGDLDKADVLKETRITGTGVKTGKAIDTSLKGVFEFLNKESPKFYAMMRIQSDLNGGVEKVHTPSLRRMSGARNVAMEQGLVKALSKGLVEMDQSGMIRRQFPISELRATAAEGMTFGAAGPRANAFKQTFPNSEAIGKFLIDNDLLSDTQRENFFTKGGKVKTGKTTQVANILRLALNGQNPSGKNVTQEMIPQVAPREAERGRLGRVTVYKEGLDEKGARVVDKGLTRYANKEAFRDRFRVGSFADKKTSDVIGTAMGAGVFPEGNRPTDLSFGEVAVEQPKAPDGAISNRNPRTREEYQIRQGRDRVTGLLLEPQISPEGAMARGLMGTTNTAKIPGAGDFRVVDTVFGPSEIEKFRDERGRPLMEEVTDPETGKKTSVPKVREVPGGPRSVDLAKAKAEFSKGIAARYNALPTDIEGTMGRLRLLRGVLAGEDGTPNKTIKGKIDDLNMHLRKLKRGEASTLPKRSATLSDKLKLGLPFQQLEQMREAERQSRIQTLSRNLGPDDPRPLLGGGATARQTGISRLPRPIPQNLVGVVDEQFMRDELLTRGSNQGVALTPEALQASRDAQRAAVTSAQAAEAQRLAAESDEAFKLLQGIIKKVATRGR